MGNVDRFLTAILEALRAPPEDRLQKMSQALQPLHSMTVEEAQLAAWRIDDCRDLFRIEDRRRWSLIGGEDDEPESN